ncbi:MAG: hypothetical protein ACYC96_03155 [Fimbriimonadaceae bacterium]
MSPCLILGSSFILLGGAPGLTGSNGTTPANTALSEAFAAPQPLATPIRLERTPRMDGVYRAEEWDLLWGQVPTGRPPEAPMQPPVTAVAPVLLPQLPPPAEGMILSGPIGPAPTPAATPPSVTGHPTQPSSAPLTQATPPPAGSPKSVPVTKPVPAGPPPGLAPMTPLNIQRIAPRVITPPPAPMAAPAQAGFMSWEPGKLYFAAFLAPGNDMLVTIDGSNNGFLVGKDNVELRVTPGATPTVKARILDATASPAPVWIDAPGFEMSSVAVSATQPDGSVFVELAVTDPGYDILNTALRDTVGLRVDGVPTSAPPTDAAMPRVMSQVQLADQRVENLPDGLGAEVGAKGRSVVAGASTSIKWQLTGSESAGVKYVEISGEGNFADDVNLLRVPSPEFSPRGQAVIDYPTRVVPSAAPGYGVLKGNLTGVGWVGGSIESSIRVAPALDVVAPALKLKPSAKSQRLTCKADIVANTDQRVEGNFQVLPPAGWRVIDGTDRTFFIYDKGAKAMRQFVMEVPAGVHGTFKTTLRVAALGTVIDQPYWITIL